MDIAVPAFPLAAHTSARPRAADRSPIHLRKRVCAALGRLFSSSGHVSSCQRAISTSSRWLARSTGFWRLQPILLNRRPTCSMLYVTPNSRLITARTRARVHTSPRNPYASGPCASNSGKCWSCPAESRGFGPPPFRLRSAASPPSLTAVNHWLTAPDVTPSASAIRVWFHPFCFSSQARNRRASRQSLKVFGISCLLSIPRVYHRLSVFRRLCSDQ